MESSTGVEKAMETMQVAPAATTAPKTVMKAMKKGMQAKKKRVSKVAKGKRAKYLVFKGTKEKTVSGLPKEDIVRSKSGKLVSRKKSALGTKFGRVEGGRP